MDLREHRGFGFTQQGTEDVAKVLKEAGVRSARCFYKGLVNI